MLPITSSNVQGWTGVALRARLVIPAYSTPDRMFTNDNQEPMSLHHTPLLEVGPRSCRYIVSASTRDAICCGAPTTSDLSRWCEHHTRLVYEPRLSTAERQQRRAA